MHDALEHIIAKFQNIVSSNDCQNLAKKCGFIQRSTSKIKGYEFAQAMMVPHGFIEAETLNTLAARMREINSDCFITASALAQRINTAPAVNFMKACFAKVLKEIIGQGFDHPLDLPNLAGFNRFLIEDSTTMELHEKLAPEFEGSGGSASKSSVKLNYILDYLSEGFVALEFSSGSKPDQSFSQNIMSILQPGDLVVRDLGYFYLKRFQEIEEKGAYYVSRWKSNENVFESKDSLEPVDLAKFIEKHLFGELMDVEVFVGKNRHPTRLIAGRIDEQGVNKRLRAANKSASRHGSKMSDKKRNLLKYSIFITNIPTFMLSGQAVVSIYCARWRVELIFKEWKSCLKIHLFKGFNIERFYCFMYARLIMCLLLGKIYAILAGYASVLGRELSGYKLIKHLITGDGLVRALREDKVAKYVDQLLLDTPKRLCKDRRKRLTLRESVRMGVSSYSSLVLRGLSEKAA